MFTARYEVNIYIYTHTHTNIFRVKTAKPDWQPPDRKILSFVH